MTLPDVRAWTPAAKTARSLESLRLISEDCSAKIYIYQNFEIKQVSAAANSAKFDSDCV